MGAAAASPGASGSPTSSVEGDVTPRQAYLQRSHSEGGRSSAADNKNSSSSSSSSTRGGRRPRRRSPRPGSASPPPFVIKPVDLGPDADLRKAARTLQGQITELAKRLRSAEAEKLALIDTVNQLEDDLAADTGIAGVSEKALSAAQAECRKLSRNLADAKEAQRTSSAEAEEARRKLERQQKRSKEASAVARQRDDQARQVTWHPSGCAHSHPQASLT